MSILYQKRGIYYYDGKDLDGTELQRSLKTKNRAEAEKKRETLDQRFGHANVSQGPHLSKCVNDYLEKRRRHVDREDLSERTLSSDRRALQLLQDVIEGELGELTVEEIETPLMTGGVLSTKRLT